MDTVRWGDFRRAHPEAEVLSRNTGHDRSYGMDPYGTYYTDRSPYFPVTDTDSRLHPREVVLGLEVNGVHKAYREADLIAAPVISDAIGGTRTSSAPWIRWAA